MLAFFEGLGKVKEVAQIRLIQQCIGLIVAWGALFCGAKLYVAGINWLVNITIILFLSGIAISSLFLSIFGKVK